jgi:hypothetical protein
MAEAERIPHGENAIALAALNMAQKIMLVLVERGVLSPQEASEAILECTRYQDEVISLTPEHRLVSSILKRTANKLRDHPPKTSHLPTKSTKTLPNDKGQRGDRPFVPMPAG